MEAGLLDDPARLEAADPGAMLRQVASSAAQVRSSLAATQETDFSGTLDAGRPRAIVVLGAGASGLAGDVLAAVCGPGCPVQIVTVRDHRLPGWVSAADLVMAVSASGATQETLAAAEDAVRRGCQLIGVGGPDTPLAGLAEQARAPFVPVRSAALPGVGLPGVGLPGVGLPGVSLPRATLWGLAVPLIAAAARFGLCDADPATCETAAAVLEDVSQRCRPDLESFVNPGKGMALDLAGTLPLIWGSSPLAGVAAARFASQLNANAKYPAIHGVLPPAGHDQVAMFGGPFAPGPAVPWDPDADDLFADPDSDGPPTPLRLVMITDTQEHPQLAKRREMSVQLAADRGVEVTELAAEGDHPLQRLASLVQLIDYTTVYLGIALGLDPSPITAITS